MSPKQLPFLLARAREWRVAADDLPARGVLEGDPALAVWREAAWCHLLLTRGLYGAAVARLRVVFRDVTGVSSPEPVSRPRCEADVLAVAADLFTRLRAAVFNRPAA